MVNAVDNIRSDLVDLVRSSNIFIATATYCSYCTRLLNDIKKLNIPEETIRVINEMHPLMKELRKTVAEAFKSYKTIPLLFIKGRFYKGYAEFVNIKQNIPEYSKLPMLSKDLVLTSQGWGIDME